MLKLLPIMLLLSNLLLLLNLRARPSQALMPSFPSMDQMAILLLMAELPTPTARGKLLPILVVLLNVLVLPNMLELLPIMLLPSNLLLLLNLRAWPSQALMPSFPSMDQMAIFLLMAELPTLTARGKLLPILVLLPNVLVLPNVLKLLPIMLLPSNLLLLLSPRAWPSQALTRLFPSMDQMAIFLLMAELPTPTSRGMLPWSNRPPLPTMDIPTP